LTFFDLELQKIHEVIVICCLQLCDSYTNHLQMGANWSSASRSVYLFGLMFFIA
jgi:hypothetical protein